MTEFISNQWYVDSDGNYYQYLYNNADYMMFRDAGNLFEYMPCSESLESLTPASLTPDFSDAKVGDECFSAQCGVESIKSLNVYGIGAIDWIGTSTGFSYNQDGRSHRNHVHPTLFNSFAQFMAYWAEEWLSYKKESEK